MKIYIKKIEGLTLPKKGSEVAAGYDIVSTSDPKIVGDLYINPADDGSFNGIYTNISYIEYETNLYIAPSVVSYHTLIFPRSSISKCNLMLANGLGLVDQDYRGQVLCRFNYLWQPNDYRVMDGNIVGLVDENKIYKKGDVIAQLVFEPTIQAEFELVDDLNQTKRGSGGFGSTDTITKIIPQSPINRQSLTEMYNKSGGISVKEKYTEEIKKREQI